MNILNGYTVVSNGVDKTIPMIKQLEHFVPVFYAAPQSSLFAHKSKITAGRAQGQEIIFYTFDYNEEEWKRLHPLEVLNEYKDDMSQLIGSIENSNKMFAAVDLENIVFFMRGIAFTIEAVNEYDLIFWELRAVDLKQIQQEFPKRNFWVSK